MNKIASLQVSQKVITEPPSYGTTFILVTAVVGVAFGLPFRVVWCRIQPLLVIALMVLGAFMRRSRMVRPSPTSHPRESLSTYDIMIRDTGNGATRWDEAIFVYAAWIAYGCLFHEARHAAADLALFDDNWISSATLIATLRAFLFAGGTCFSYSQALVDRAATFWLAFFMYAALLLAIPPLNGVPHTLQIYEIIARMFAFICLFAVNEFMRNVLDHWHFAALVSEDSLDSNTALHLEDVSKVVNESDLPTLKISLDNNVMNAQLPSAIFNVTENQRALPVSWSVLRSAWVLTLSNLFVTYFCTFLCFAFAFHSAARWSRSAAHWTRKRSTGKNASVIIDIPVALSPTAKVFNEAAIKPEATQQTLNPMQQQKYNFTKRLLAQKTCVQAKRKFDEERKKQNE